MPQPFSYLTEMPGAANAGPTLIATITTIRATTANNTRMRLLLTSPPLQERAALVSPAESDNAITVASMRY